MTQNNAFAARTCIVGVVVMNESDMASDFPEAGNFNVSNADMYSDLAGRLFDFWSSSRSRTFTISPTTSTTGRHLEFDRDYNSRTAFQGVFRHFA